MDIYQQSIEDYCPIFVYLDDEQIKFDQSSQRWIIFPSSDLEFSYKLDLGSAKIDGPILGKNITLYIQHKKYKKMCDKTLYFSWINGSWCLMSWTPSKMTFPSLKKNKRQVPEVIQECLTNSVRKLGKKLCQDFDFLNDTGDDWHYISDQRRKVGSFVNREDRDEFREYVEDRKDAITLCADRLLAPVDCGDPANGSYAKLRQYFLKVLDDFM